MSNEEKVDYQPPRHRHPHSLMFQFLKAAAVGALAGLGLVVVNEAFSKRKIVVNKYMNQLPLQDLEGLAEEADICEYFHLMNVKQFRTYNKKAYDTALEKCSDLCFLAESIAKGLLEQMKPKIELGEVDFARELQFDTEALNLWYEVHDNLQALYNSVRDTEYDKVDARDREEENYKKAVAKWELDCVNWETRKMERQRNRLMGESDSFDPFGSITSSNNDNEKNNNNNNNTNQDENEDDPKPIKPIEPIYEKFRSDFVEEYATAIDHRTRQIFVYIRDSVDKFRKEYSKFSKVNVKLDDDNDNNDDI